MDIFSIFNIEKEGVKYTENRIYSKTEVSNTIGALHNSFNFSRRIH